MENIPCSRRRKCYRCYPSVTAQKRPAVTLTDHALGLLEAAIKTAGSFFCRETIPVYPGNTDNTYPHTNTLAHIL
jgi:hypothetical protein